MKKEKSSILHWLVLAVLGLALIIGHNLAQDIIGKILAVGLILTAACPWLLWLFTRDEAILWNAREAVRYTLPVYVVYAVNQVYLGAIKGLGDTTWPMVCTLLCYSVFRVVWCAALIPVFESMRVVYLSYDVSFFLMTAMLVPMYRRRLRLAASHLEHCPLPHTPHFLAETE